MFPKFPLHYGLSPWGPGEGKKQATPWRSGGLRKVSKGRKWRGGSVPVTKAILRSFLEDDWKKEDKTNLRWTISENHKAGRNFRDEGRYAT